MGVGYFWVGVDVLLKSTEANGENAKNRSKRRYLWWSWFMFLVDFDWNFVQSASADALAHLDQIDPTL